MNVFPWFPRFRGKINFTLLTCNNKLRSTGFPYLAANMFLLIYAVDFV